MEEDNSTSAGPDQKTHRALAAFSALVSLSAWGGAVSLMAGVIDFGPEIDQRLPFNSLVLAGCALAVIVALPTSFLAWQAWYGRGNVGQTAMLVGMALMGWIVGQVAVIQSFSWFQPAYVVVGIAIWMAGNQISTS